MDNNLLKGCLNEEGKLTVLPSKRRKKLAALVWVSEQIPEGKEFTEKEFNDFLRTLHTFGDPATLRRELFDYFLINREANGSSYSVNPEKPNLEDLLIKYCS
ncbi:MAG: DUF2087 domain-containing protein [Clostridia bacterium]|nr:DUF2087 domain-containing protein [Clostridia bacterium]